MDWTEAIVFKMCRARTFGAVCLFFAYNDTRASRSMHVRHSEYGDVRSLIRGQPRQHPWRNPPLRCGGHGASERLLYARDAKRRGSRALIKLARPTPSARDAK
ncbi:hypothetical protein EVAR_43066_1 [Eumeta japonica]|uniref:Uncharacterized protein n=1 Tax=Eumeta variegata TaxID=151549 RepID=A0A4C1WXC8_EUMVA|nr:hypothetical protein EVAR_43066_1 [Eumeta japonica]